LEKTGHFNFALTGKSFMEVHSESDGFGFDKSGVWCKGGSAKNIKINDFLTFQYAENFCVTHYGMDENAQVAIFGVPYKVTFEN